MNTKQRAAISAIAYTLLMSKKISNIYSYSDGNYMSISCEVKNKKVSVYDYERGCHIDVSESVKNSYSFYDYGTGGYYDFSI